MRFFSGRGISLDHLKKQKIVVLGYGSQGRAQALNLRDSGCRVVVGLRPGSPSFRIAKKDKMTALPLDRALHGAGLICFLFPDEHHASIYKKYVSPKLQKGMSLVFAHGFNITFKKIKPPFDVNVILIGPKGPGPTLRKAYVNGDGLVSLIAVHQDVDGRAKKLALAFAKAIGCCRRGIYETTFREETWSDLFGEQTVLCGGVVELMKSAFEVLVEEGISPQAAYFECFHELKFIVDLLHQGGLSAMAEAISPTAYYGGLTRGKRLINDRTKQKLRQIFQEIKSQRFADEWLRENANGIQKFLKLAKAFESHPIEVWGKKIRRQIGFI